MIFQNDDRGVSEVVGVVVLFGFLIIALSTFQTVVVPQENAEAEFNSYQAAQGDMIDLRNDLIASGTRGINTGSSVQTGVTYPERIFTLNPPTARGGLSTGPTGTVTVENASALSTEATNTRAFWDGTARSYNTTGITFRPQYNEFQGQQIVTTGETVYAVGDGQIAPLTGQSLISGDQIRLVTVDGDLDQSGVRSSLTTVPRSVSTRTVVVTGAGENPVTLRLDPPPQTTATEWISAYSERILSSNQAVENVTERSGQVVIELNGSRTYQLKLARVTVGDGGSDEGTSDPAYLITQQGEASTVASGKRTIIAAEARDAFNNPVEGVNVTYSITSGSATFLDENGNAIQGTVTRPTNDQGRAPQSIQVTEIGADVIVNATIEGTAGSLTTTTFTIQTPNENNPVELAGVTFEGGTVPDGGGQPKDVTITFKNQNLDTDRTIDRFRMDFYQGANPPTGGVISGTSFSVGGSAVSTSISLPANQTTSRVIDFNNGQVNGGEWFIITVQYDTGDTAQYFVSV
ncbi:hypothetical protein [Halorubrum sp. HHNYT27]|uniref:hypothetical protein n=1 Tax=Halorubrum sp. HHNYT27 TaxID=3402275 RepID=UPI003EBE46F1